MIAKAVMNRPSRPKMVNTHAWRAAEFRP